MDQKQESSFTVDLDRIEEGIAVILAPAGFQWHLPESFLPEGVTEGMSMKVTLETDLGETSARIERIRKLRESMANR